MQILMMLAALAGEPDLATSPPAPNPTVTAPDWRRKATGADAMKVYPSRALRRGISGGAIVKCMVDREGTLVDCSVVDEAPPGQGFGEAALKLMHFYTMRPMTRDGLPVDGGTVRMPILFTIPR